jgi:glycosyltransferase 2 family protein
MRVSTTPDRPDVKPGRIRGTPRVFAAAADEPRSRRLTDVVLVVAALLGLLVLGLAEEPSPGFIRAVRTLLDALPDFLDAIWQLFADLLAVLAVVLVVLAGVRRRWTLLRDLVLAVLAAFAVSGLVHRVVSGAWPDVVDELLRADPPAAYPALRLAVSAAVVITAAPHLTRPVRRVGHWLVGLAAIGMAVLGAATPLGAIAGILAASVGAGLVHLLFGSCAGRPSLELVTRALSDLGVPTRRVGAADRQGTGSFLVDAEDADGGPLVVKVFGRDAHDVALLTTLWRTVWYREAGAPIRLGRLQQVEHEAFLTLLARQAGVPTHTVVTAGATVDDDALLVLRPAGTPLSELAAVTEHDLRGVWATVDRLHAAGIAHGRLDGHRMMRLGAEGNIGLVDFAGGSAAATVLQRRADRVQALVSTVLLAGPERAVAVAADALGTDGLNELLPYLQPAVLTGAHRRSLRDHTLDLDNLRGTVAAEVGAEVPQLQQLRRITVGAILRVLLPALALIILISAAGNFDWSQLPELLEDASWALIVGAFFLAQTPRLTQSMSTLGSSPVPLPLGPTYALQLATSYINLAVPSTAARVAVNVRYFQRHGVPAATAMAAGALDGFSGFLTQASLLLGLLLLTPMSLDLELSADVASTAWRVLSIAAVVAVVALVALVAVPRWRRAALGFVRRFGGEALDALRGLHSPRRLALLFGGNLATEVLFAASLGLFVEALGASVGLGQLLVINISVALLAGLLPVPGGIGVAEAGLTFGLVQAGVPEEIAFTAVLLQRISTFYLPPLWGWFALRWLQRNDHL